MSAVVGFIAIVGILYAYVGYPIVLYVLGFFKKKQETYTTSPISGITIIIACRNEEKAITEKLENTLSLKWKNKTLSHILKNQDSEVQVIVASDASDDTTHSIVDAYRSFGVELAALKEREGKEAAQKNALRFTRHEVVLFTDTKVLLDEDVLERVSEYFMNPRVGAVSSVDRVIDERGQSGEGAYVLYEMAVRNLESSLYSLVGLSGSCFAVRKCVTSHFPTTVPSDFCMLIEARKQGFRGIHGADIEARYAAVHSPQKEFDRKVRTVVRGMRSVWQYRNEFFLPHDKLLLFQIISHKVLRWLVPFFVLISFVSSMVSCFDSLFWLLIFLSHIALFGLWYKGHLDPDSRMQIVVKICFFFVLSNYSIAVAWLKFLRGDTHSVWNPSDKG